MTENTKAMYGGFFRRFIAYMIDSFILVIPMMALMFLYFGVAGEETIDEMANAESMSGSEIVWNFVFMIIGILYWAWMESSSKQATLGKLVMGLKVTDYQGQRISFGRGVLRSIGRIVSSIILFIGFLLALFTRRKQTLHDLLTKTLVVKKDAMAEMTFDPPQ